jgi:V/A-type H+-transporting ATPase subunit K
MTRNLKPVVGFLVINLLVALGLTYLFLAPAWAAEDTAAAAATTVDASYGAWAMIGAAIAAGLASLGTAYAVAVVGSAAVGALAEKPELLGRLLILVGLAEGIAIYGLIVAVLILNKV